jgi:hypothetical protein
MAPDYDGSSVWNMVQVTSLAPGTSRLFGKFVDLYIRYQEKEQATLIRLSVLT